MDERRKDYFVMYTHHIVTIALVGLSWAWGYWRIGLLVVYVHDVSDIAVDLLKMVNYMKLEGKRGWFASEFAYLICVLSWLYWRLWMYPMRAIRGSYIDAWDVFATYPRHSDPAFNQVVFGVEISPPDMPNYFECNTMLFILLGLHVYWFHLFIMIGYRILTESAREASRQEYEGDSDGEAEEADSIEDVPMQEGGMPPSSTTPGDMKGKVRRRAGAAKA